ncbi:hypothetical protein H8356DRAFT_1417791 [Neocallimastix lanati (nom. inval.)]|nr:hypothetical protein H8356DRAFT_1417791 [Neocallimastix sp. JGI-2020a]
MEYLSFLSSTLLIQTFTVGIYHYGCNVKAIPQNSTDRKSNYNKKMMFMVMYLNSVFKPVPLYVYIPICLQETGKRYSPSIFVVIIRKNSPAEVYLSKNFPDWTVAILTGCSSSITHSKDSKCSSCINHFFYIKAMILHVHLSSAC